MPPIDACAPPCELLPMLGARPGSGVTYCLRPISPFPAQAKFIVTAKAGAGVIAAQLFSK